MVIQNGAIVTYTAEWPYGTYAGFVDYAPTVYNDLNAAGLTVQGVQGGFSLLNSLLGSPFKITLTLQVSNGLGFGNENDLMSIISHYVQQESGNAPLSQSVPYVKNPSDTSTQATGQAATPGTVSTGTPGATHVCGDPSWGFFDDPGQYISCLTSKGLSSLGLIAIGLMVGVAFILFSEHEV